MLVRIMLELKKEIEVLKSNVSAMVLLIGELRKSELQRRQEIGTLLAENENLKKQVQFLEEKNKMANMASAIDPGKREEMKLKIRELVREIDGCIAMIKN